MVASEQCLKPPPASIRQTAVFFRSCGLSVNLLGGDKKPIHKWKSQPDYTAEPQTDAQFDRLPWNGFRRRDGTHQPPPAGVSIINGIGGVVTFDLDKCTDPALLTMIASAMDLPSDYRWKHRSGSHNGYGLAVVCFDPLPESILSLLSGGILIGTPRDGYRFKQLELRYSGCHTVMPPSLHPSGNHYEWLHGTPDTPPIVVSAEQLIVGFLAIAELPSKAARPENSNSREQSKPIERVCTRLTDIGLSQFSSAKAYVEAVIVAARHTYDLEAEMQRDGCSYISTDADGTRHYSSISGEAHDHEITYAVSDSTDGKGGQRGVSLSTWGKCNKSDYPQGFDVLNWMGKTWRDVAPAPEPKIYRAARAAPPTPTPAERAARRKDAERKRAARQRAATELRADIIGRAAIDEEMPEQARQLLDIHLTIAGQRGWHHASVARMAELSGYGERWVQRFNQYLVENDYLTRAQPDPTETAIWTLVQSAKPRASMPQTDDNRVIALPPMSPPQQNAENSDRSPVYISRSDPKIDPDLTCEPSASPPARVEPASLEEWEACEDAHGADELNALDQGQPAQPGAEGYSVDCAQYADGRIVWRLWDDALDRVISEHFSEADALNLALQLSGRIDLDIPESEARACIASLCGPIPAEQLAQLGQVPEVELNTAQDGILEAAGGASYVGVPLIPEKDPRAVPSWMRQAGDITITANPKLQHLVRLQQTWEPIGPRLPSQIADPGVKHEYYALIGKARKVAATNPKQARYLRDQAARLLNGAELRPTAAEDDIDALYHSADGAGDGAPLTSKPAIGLPPAFASGTASLRPPAALQLAWEDI